MAEGTQRSTSDDQLVSGEYVALSVSDTGVGMTPEVMARIFEPFYSTRAPNQGSGLGLATVHGAVRQNGGQIQVQSTPGEGSRFKLFLPRAVDETAPCAPAEPQEVPKVPTVLVVEDEPSLRGLTVRLLERGGYKVLEAGDGEEALEVAAAFEPTIDLLLTDVIMPRMNGHRLAEELKMLRPQLKVLFVSGYDENMVADHGVLASEVEFLAKPFAGKELLRRVTSALD